MTDGHYGDMHLVSKFSFPNDIIVKASTKKENGAVQHWPIISTLIKSLKKRNHKDLVKAEAKFEPK